MRSIVAADLSRAGVGGWLGPLRGVESHRLDNGLEVRLLRGSQAPIVVASLWYRVGCRDEEAGQNGIAHFLEHMMFKGSARYPMGEIDRLTQSLGGENNAFTSHDVTAYYFGFAAEHWTTALDIEADRMESLVLDEAEIERERQVILEEIAMYEDDPWDALELETTARYYGEFPYGRPILGARETVSAIDRPALESFYRRHYRPDNAVLVVAGDLGAGVLEAVESRLGRLRAAGGIRETWPPTFAPPQALARMRQARGSLPRMLLTLPAPSAEHRDYPVWRLLVTILGGGRSSRLYRGLVDEGELCSSMSAELTEMAGPGLTMISAEVLPGVELEAVEDAVLSGLADLSRQPPTAEEITRARRLLLSDWVFGLERIHYQALMVGQAEAALSPGYPKAHLRGILECDREALLAVAERYLPSGVGEPAGVIGWSRAEAS